MANKITRRVSVVLVAPPVIALNMMAIWLASVVIWSWECLRVRTYLKGLGAILKRETRAYLKEARVAVLDTWEGHN